MSYDDDNVGALRSKQKRPQLTVDSNDQVAMVVMTTTATYGHTQLILSLETNRPRAPAVSRAVAVEEMTTMYEKPLKHMCVF